MISSAKPKPKVPPPPQKSEPEDKFKEEEPEYDESDEFEPEDDEDYYAQPEKLEAKSSKIPTTTDVPEQETTVRGRSEDTTIRIMQKSPMQKQVTTLVNPDKNVRLVQTQNGRTFKYPLDTKVENAAIKKVTDDSDVEDGNAEDIIISKTTQQIKYKTRYLPSKPIDKNSVDDSNLKNKKTVKPDSYVSVTNSLSGNLSDDSKFDSTYITKSSSCGHSSFSCNIVYSSEGKRTQVCKPRKPNPKC